MNNELRNERMNAMKQQRPTCPHCGYMLTYDDMLAVSECSLFDIAPREERASLACPQCDKEFWVQGGFTPHYTSAFAEEEL